MRPLAHGSVELAAPPRGLTRRGEGAGGRGGARPAAVVNQMKEGHIGYFL